MSAIKLHLYIFPLLGLLVFATIFSVVKFTFLGVGDVSSHRELTAHNIGQWLWLRLWSHPSKHTTPFSYKAFSSPDHVFADEHLSAMTADHSKDLVVVFVDVDYLETFGVWLDHYKQHDNSNRVLCVIAISGHAYEKLDQVFTLSAAQDAFRNLGETVLVNFLPGEQHANERVVSYLWVERLNFMGRIINAYPALNVLYSDADAIWLKDPAQLYNHAQHLSSDVVASRGTYPGECALGREANGQKATVCFGFTYFRNSAALQTLALNMQNNVQNYVKDDQKTINCVLNKSWISNDSIDIDNPSSMARFTLSDGSFTRSFHYNGDENDGTAHDIKVSVLPYHQVMRRCDLAPSLDDVVVAHCYTTEKEGSQKMNMFAKYGFLTEGDSSIRHFFGETFQNQRAAVTAPPLPPPSMKEAAYNLAMERFWRRIKNNNLPYYPDLVSQYQSNGGALMRNTRVLNSIRIPKSGSSALSATARALAGCHPDGYPCCKFPGDPEGSCPRKDLMCPLVTGCTDHRPNYSGDETVITSLRNPIKRSVSAFFYAPPHTSVEVGQAHTWEKFVENIQSPKYRNILTKMLSGAYAYDSFDASRHTVSNAKARLCSIAWFGLSEMPVISHMMLYETVDFRQLEPNPVTFGLPAKDAVLTEDVEKVDGLRVNGDSEYKNFISTSFQSNNGASLVADHNKEDIEVFQFAEVLFCQRFLAKLGLVDEMRQISLGVEEIERCANLLGGRGDVEQLC